MKQAGIKRNDGVSMNMEQPHPEPVGDIVKHIHMVYQEKNRRRI